MNLSDVHSSSIKRLIMPRICYQDEQQQHEIKPFVPIIVSFRALRIIEKIINEDCCDPCSSAYAFIADPNMDQSGTDYILCNGTIDEAKYKPKEKKCFNN
ncbi:unnamed protein product [Onchocerca ochengi]|uniref:Uncharacterized protein n=1 Tax=Onchocerca ochengi TaxID=42157 RepID=A0A182EST1_ONCOC|nr:unnamed protein product [Onchocerca ochengi]